MMSPGHGAYPRNRQVNKKNWIWPKTIKDALLIGEENVSRITASLYQTVQPESFPGARF